MSSLLWKRETQEGSASLPIVVSYFTDPFYLREAFDLVRSCQAHGVDYHVERVPDLGGWLANTNYKAAFVRRLSDAYPRRSLLWLDADARVRARPSLFAGMRAPVAYRTINRRPASGTVYLDRGEGRNALADAWVEAVRESPEATDQVCLGAAVQRTGSPRLELPSAYCWIFDFDEADRKVESPDPRTYQPVIEHMQASRWTRKGRP